MTRDHELELRLHGLAEKLNARPSLAPSVMHRLQRQISTEQQSALAVGMTRQTLRSRVSYATALSLVLACGTVAYFWLIPPGRRSSVAFADVQQAIGHVESAVLECKFRKCPWYDCRQFFRADRSVVRVERSNGAVVVLTDTKEGRLLALNTRKKVAGTQSAVRGLESHLHLPLSRWSTPREFLDHLAGIEQLAVKSIGEHQIAGRDLIGFELPRDQFAEDCGMRSRIWVDPRTQLPVRFEWIPDAPDDLAASFLRYTITFTFNQTLNDNLFRMTVPEGYTVLEDDAPTLWDTVWQTAVPLPPQDEELASPVVELGMGIGGARFGMSLERVLDLLGRPDNASKHREPTAEEQKQIDATYGKATKEAAEKHLNKAEQRRYVSEATNRLDVTHRTANGMTLEYLSRGYHVIVTKEQGLMRIFCYAEYPDMRAFTGRTAKGIQMGATVEQIEKAYGPPDVKDEAPDGNSWLYYKSLHTAFDVRKDGLWQLSLDKE